MNLLPYDITAMCIFTDFIFKYQLKSILQRDNENNNNIYGVGDHKQIKC